MVLLIRGFLFLLAVVITVAVGFILMKLAKYLAELTEPTTEPLTPRPPVPSKYIDDKPVTNRRMIHLRTVYIPNPISHNIEEAVTSISDSEYELGYIFDNLYTEKVDGGLILFMRFKLL